MLLDIAEKWIDQTPHVELRQFMLSHEVLHCRSDKKEHDHATWWKRFEADQRLTV